MKLWKSSPGPVNSESVPFFTFLFVVFTWNQEPLNPNDDGSLSSITATLGPDMTVSYEQRSQEGSLRGAT